MLPPPLRGLLFNVGLGFTAALLLMLAVIGLGVTQMAQLNAELERVVSVNNVKTRLASRMRDTLRDRAVLMHNIVVSIDPWEKDALFLQFQRIRRTLRQGPQPAGRHAQHAGREAVDGPSWTPSPPATSRSCSTWSKRRSTRTTTAR